ncbi:hypothetical protein E2562_002800 [Oryza meyeriana var. granulata]|uniref:Uncharacterized protein n=1 Tax=Oryza meyeriana var. granulata TaxID=110450 RepID=A0A6G1BQU1_9ORYZ|nr:hypothetical protein E2562_002800 [Oryza meyeriana var. granulata]
MAALTIPLPLALCSASSPHCATLLALPCRAAARPLASPGRCPARSDAPSPRRAGGLALAPCAAKPQRQQIWDIAPMSRSTILRPGDPVWAISQATISDLIGLSLNFFFILPLLNSAGVLLLESPVLHPMAEGLFNFVTAWTLLFAPLLFTDSRRDRFKGSLDLLWGFQMFLTNTFLIPYMAIRLNDPVKVQSPPQTSKLGSVMVEGAPIVGLTGGLNVRADTNAIKPSATGTQSTISLSPLLYSGIWLLVLGCGVVTGGGVGITGVRVDGAV